MKKLQDPDIQAIIQSNLNTEPQSLLLKLSKRQDIPVKEIIEQIIGRKKAKEKLPELAQNPAIIFPAVISMEQCSSEITAKFKADLFSGDRFIDLTCGLGVDARFFARNFKRVDLIEPNESLIGIVKHNFEVLGINNAHFHNTNAAEFISNFSGKADLIYIDPSRRSKENNKVFLLDDCEPDILNLLPKLLEISNVVMIKTAPMLDIDKALEQLKNTERVIVLSLNNECKEVLYIVKKEFTSEPVIETQNIFKTGVRQSFQFLKSAERNLSVFYSDPSTYLFDPNSSIAKAGAFKSVSEIFNLNKLSGNTHLYTSNKLCVDFPGKKYEVIACCRYDKKEIQKFLPEKKAVIIIKNFPETIESVKKKLGLKEGGEFYLFCVRNKEEKPVLIIGKLL